MIYSLLNYIIQKDQSKGICTILAVASTIKASFDSGGHSNISAVLRVVTRSQSVTIHPCHIHARSESPASCSSKLE